MSMAQQIKAVGAAALVAILVLSMLGCAGPTEPAVTPTPTQPAVTPTPTKPAVTPTEPAVTPTLVRKPTGNLAIGMRTESRGLFDNVKTYGGGDWEGPLHDKLTRSSVVQGKPGLETRLAERWELSPDAKVLTYYLKEGVLFHDGTEMTAEDVAWSMEQRITDIAWYPEYSEMFERAEVIDPYTVVAVFKTPHPYIAIYNSWYGRGSRFAGTALPSAYIEEKGW